jgi:hypothetical protein
MKGACVSVAAVSALCEESLLQVDCAVICREVVGGGKICGKWKECRKILYFTALFPTRP